MWRGRDINPSWPKSLSSFAPSMASYVQFFTCANREDTYRTVVVLLAFHGRGVSKDDALVHLGILSSPPSHVVVIVSPRFAAISSTFLSEYPVKPRWSAIRWRFLHPEHRIMTTPFSYECLLKVLATVSLHTVHMNSMYLVGVNWRISDPTLQVSAISEWLKSSSTRGKPEGIMWALAWEEQHLFWQPTIWGRSLLKEETLLAEATNGLCEDLEDKERENRFWGPRNREEEPVGT